MQDTSAPIGLSLPSFGAGETLPARVQSVLEQAIINGQLTPGSRINADEMAAHFGVSRIPVREALRSLHEAGWVEIRPRHGVRVRSRDRKELEDLFEFRAEVERSVARYAAERRDDRDLAELDEIAASNHRALDQGDLATLDTNGLRFYSAIRSAARNDVMAETSVSLEQRARFYYITIADDLGLGWPLVHEQIIEHIRRREAMDAGELISTHIRDTGRQTQALLFD